ncbi:MAG: GNAT family N-acetyltransferase [Ignavibacteriae bacterium]|nr:GNAT family N-acetyltransferase [Ignavibacteriota bacterium]
MHKNINIDIRKAESIEDMEIVRKLFENYSSELGFDLEFQDFNNELINLPGKYSAPEGCLLLARYSGQISGCVGLRKLDNDTCEMKRLYVKDEFRGISIGKNLALEIILEAKKIGYRKMRLDTLNTMYKAINIYKKIGFYEIKSYRFNPFNNAVFMELKLY